jgi:5-methylcytosine-specific restriction endonuclease McrA
VARVQLLLDELFLSRATDTVGLLGRAPLQWISEWLRLDPASHFGEATLRHLVALQLAPRTAIAYESTNPTPRWKLVDEYLAGRFVLTELERERIARLVAATLDQASSSRGSRSLIPETAIDCSICRLPFRRQPDSVSMRDPYKPTWQAPEELCRPEVDHVLPISSLGEHRTENLQVICRACNLAKGSGLLLNPEMEIRFAGLDVSFVPRVHLFRLLQWLIARQDARCGRCGSNRGELTMRPIHKASPLVRTSMALTCYSCI